VENSSEVAGDRALAMALFYSGVGMLIAAFFLSRSYCVLLFLFWGWAAGLHNGSIRRGAPADLDALPAMGMRWAGIAIATIPAFYLMVRVLLIT
jgi:hypothetical protein